MKKIIMTSLIGLTTLLPLATQAEALKGETGTFCVGNQVSQVLDGQYVERIFIAAEGIRNSGFINVYADGVKVQRIGVPGYDPDYTFRVRRNVQEIKLTFEDTCSRILDFKIYTPKSAPTTQRYSKDRALSTSWGAEVMNLIGDIDDSLVDDNLMIDPMYSRVFKPLKKVAMYANASESVRDGRSLIKSLRALEMAKIIRDNKTYLFNRLDRGQFEYMIADLLTILEDVLEHTDVKQNEIQETINFIEAELEG